MAAGERAGWARRRVSIVLPITVARAAWAGARRHPVGPAGGFEVGPAEIVLWAASPTDGEPAEAVARFAIRWLIPSYEAATIHEIGWRRDRADARTVLAAIDALVADAT